MPKLTNIVKVGQVVEAQSAPDNVTVITLGDREADVYEFLLCAEQRDAKYVIRAAQDRRLERSQPLGRVGQREECSDRCRTNRMDVIDQC